MMKTLAISRGKTLNFNSIQYDLFSLLVIIKANNPKLRVMLFLWLNSNYKQNKLSNEFESEIEFQLPLQVFIQLGKCLFY